MGDLNLLERNELPPRIGFESEIPLKSTDRTKNEAERKTWSSLTDIALVHYQPEHTRIGHNPQNVGDKYLIAPRIDRIYLSLLPWQAINTKIKTHCVIDAAKASDKCGSDHSPDATNIVLKQHKKTNQRPITKWLAQHPTHQNILEESLKTFYPDVYEDPFEAFEVVKQTMRTASKKAMKMAHKTDTAEQKIQIVLQASRALIYNLASVAKHVKRDFPELGNHLSIDEDGKVYLNNASAFHKLTQSIAGA